MKKILIVSTEIVKDKYSCSLITAKVVEELSRKHHVDVVTEWMAVFNFEHNIQNIWVTQKPFLYDVCRSRGGKRIFATLKFRYDKIIRTLAFRKLIKKINFNSYDYVIAFGGGDFFIAHRVLSEFSMKAKLWGYIHDPYPSQVYPYPYYSEETKKTKAELELYQKVFEQYDTLWFPSTLLAHHMQKFYHYSDAKVFVFPHLLPNIDVKKIPVETEKLNEYGVVCNHFFIHAGTILPPRKIDTLIQAFSKLKEDKKIAQELKLLFVGNINYDYQHLLGIKDVILIDRRVPYNEINMLCKAAKALLIIEHDGNFSPFLPGKFPEYLAFKKPIMHFGPKHSEINFICGEEHNSFSAPLTDFEAISKVLLHGGEPLSENEKIMSHFNIERLIASF
ncbi:glycosyltransferase [Flavobacterium aciduliphilum]|uniref:Glycosyltransferase involved in cell wall biosynthesis n=1 Tax=Flavobacterium aciduliphilum TaxID=1101402 RepID=A0A328Y8U0_9FLAO|nr:glycosyltransferase [Flavobacterium aciduliphilum]RAR69296.1 glycosyltransferase involved in cell wall biosynthesis [Flavobacterium aciduliphilum]